MWLWVWIGLLVRTRFFGHQGGVSPHRASTTVAVSKCDPCRAHLMWLLWQTLSIHHHRHCYSSIVLREVCLFKVHPKTCQMPQLSTAARASQSVFHLDFVAAETKNKQSYRNICSEIPQKWNLWMCKITWDARALFFSDLTLLNCNDPRVLCSVMHFVDSLSSKHGAAASRIRSISSIKTQKTSGTELVLFYFFAFLLIINISLETSV